jgi:hypothetical protein
VFVDNLRCSVMSAVRLISAVFVATAYKAERAVMHQAVEIALAAVETQLCLWLI